MVGKNWRDLFDMVIVQADKPNFFTDRRKYVSRALLPGPWALCRELLLCLTESRVC